jgi:O-antigen ligase
VALVGAILLLGLTGFFWKYAQFFQKGATSVSARFDYWSAAVQTARAKPVFGTGPGTFAIPYHKIKRPESEMARLVHNDYLEQASDSGVPGFALYTIFIAAALVRSFPRRSSESGDRRASSQSEAEDQEWLMFSVWLGLLGWCLQGLVEFGLYIPALAWPAFALMGWLIARTPSRNTDVQHAG